MNINERALIKMLKNLNVDLITLTKLPLKTVVEELIKIRHIKKPLTNSDCQSQEQEESEIKLSDDIIESSSIVESNKSLSLEPPSSVSEDCKSNDHYSNTIISVSKASNDIMKKTNSEVLNKIPPVEETVFDQPVPIIRYNKITSFSTDPFNNYLQGYSQNVYEPSSLSCNFYIF